VTVTFEVSGEVLRAIADDIAIARSVLEQAAYPNPNKQEELLHLKAAETALAGILNSGQPK
jgi:hypothetical protein